MAIFNCYFSSPEGNWCTIYRTEKWWFSSSWTVAVYQRVEDGYPHFFWLRHIRSGSYRGAWLGRRCGVQRILLESVGELKIGYWAVGLSAKSCGNSENNHLFFRFCQQKKGMYNITTALRLLVRGDHTKMQDHFFGDPPLNVKLVAERPPGVVFVGRSSKYLQNVSLHFQGPPQKHLEKCSLHFGYVTPLKRWWL